MRRALIVGAYALAGLGIALALSFATYALAGHELSDPAGPVQPVAGATDASATPSKARPTHDPSHDEPSPVPAATQTVPLPTASPGSGGTGDSSRSTPLPTSSPSGDSGSSDGSGGSDHHGGDD